MKDRKLFNLNMPNDIYEYLNQESKRNYTTMTQYVIKLILEDKERHGVNLYTEGLKESFDTSSDPELAEVIKNLPSVESLREQLDRLNHSMTLLSSFSVDSNEKINLD